MKTRFELEDEIMKLYAFVDNIENAVEFLAESDVDPKVIDAMSNILLGTSTLMGLHAEKMLDTMAQCFKLNEYRDEIVNSTKNWTSEMKSAIHHGDMSYDPDSSELSVEVPLTDADNRVTTKCRGKCRSTMTGFGYE